MRAVGVFQVSGRSLTADTGVSGFRRCGIGRGVVHRFYDALFLVYNGGAWKDSRGGCTPFLSCLNLVYNGDAWKNTRDRCTLFLIGCFLGVHPVRSKKSRCFGRCFIGNLPC
jgi:hypothetical protein